MAVDGSGLTYSPLSVERFFDRYTTYEVPQYQRGYSWTDEEIEELLKDLKEAFDSFPEETYLLGQLIVCPSNLSNPGQSSWQLIDGQQRSTSLFLFILRVLKNIEHSEDFAQLPKHKQNDLVAIRSLVAAPDPNDPEKSIARIKVAADGPDYVRRLLEDISLPAGDASPTQQHIRAAYDQIGEFLNSQLGSIDAQWEFLNFVLRHVWVVRLDLVDSNHALRVFLKVNNRGLVLDDADLLKSLLFQKVSSNHDYDQLSKLWDDATNELFSGRLKRPKSMEFLMKALVGIETGKSVPSGRVFEEWSSILTDEQKVKQFAFTLPGKARNLANLTLGKTPLNPSLPMNDSYGTYVFRMVQQFEVLLAADHLSPDSFQLVALFIEERTILSLLSGEKNQDWERVLHKWAQKIRGLNPQANLDEIKIASSDVLTDIDELFVAASAAIQKLSYATASHRPKLRYILGRVAKYTQGLVQNPEGQLPLSNYLTTTNKQGTAGYDLEHVFPKDIAQLPFWDQQDNEELINSIGNLVLLHPKDNRSASNKLPGEQEKVTNYGGSFLWINKIMVDRTKLGLMQPRVEKAVSDLQAICPPDLHNWGALHVNQRAEMYWQILETEMRTNLGI